MANLRGVRPFKAVFVPACAPLSGRQLSFEKSNFSVIIGHLGQRRLGAPDCLIVALLLGAIARFDLVPVKREERCYGEP